MPLALYRDPNVRAIFSFIASLVAAANNLYSLKKEVVSPVILTTQSPYAQ